MFRQLNTGRIFTDANGQFVKAIGQTLVVIDYINSVTGKSITGRAPRRI